MKGCTRAFRNSFQIIGSFRKRSVYGEIYPFDRPITPVDVVFRQLVETGIACERHDEQLLFFLTLSVFDFQPFP